MPVSSSSSCVTRPTSSTVVTPSLAGANTLISISMDGPTDGWAVGYRGASHHLLLLRYRGFWSIDNSIANMSGSGRLRLTSVSATAPDSAWLVGNHVGHTTRLEAFLWNGVQWTGIGSRPTKAGTGFRSVSAVGSTEAFAAGGDTFGKPFITHWSGGQIVRSQLGGVTGTFVSVSATTTTRAWAVAAQDSARMVATGHWHEVPIAAPTGTESLASVTIASRAAFAVGRFLGTGGAMQTLAEMIC